MSKLQTDLQLKRYTHKGEPRLFSCGKVAGLQVRCFPSGAKRFYYRKKHKGKMISLTLGEYPKMSLAQASQYANQLSLLIPKGYSSQALRTAICYSNPHANDIPKYLSSDAVADSLTIAQPEPDVGYVVTFGDVHLDWYEKDGKHRKHKAQVKQHLSIPKNHFASIYNRLMVDLTIHDFVDALKDCWLNQQPTAKKASHILKAMCLSYAASNRNYNPVVMNAAFFTELLRNRHGKPQSKSRKQPHIPHHKAPQFYSEFVDKRDGEAMSNIAAKVVMFTGKRVGEVVALRWDQLKDGIWYQEEFDGKTPDIYDIALTPRVLDLIESARQAGTGLRTSNHFVFPSDNRSEGHITPDSVRVQTHKTSFGNQQSPHGWRHVIRGWGRHTGADPQVLEFALGHKESGIAGHYGSHEVHDRTRKVLTQWEDFLTGEANE